MKPHILILILILITPIIGCNEKISPSLQESNAGTDTDSDSGSDGSDEDPLYYFKLTNSADASLGYKLHKTGSGNWNADCTVGSDSPIKNGTFTTDGVKDITCFLEAEELSLYHSGLKFKIESAPNTCNFIQYVPYSYYNRMPGESTTSYVKISCAEGVTDNNILTYATITNPSFGNMIEVSGGGFAGCDEYVNQDLSSAVRESFEEESPNFCRFNYTDRGEEQCDIGTVNVTTYTFSDEGGTILPDEGVTTTIPCGGKIMNCVKGPLKQEVPDSETPYKRMIGLQEADKSATKEYSYPGLIEQDEYKASGSYVYANYRRELANKNIEYGYRIDAVFNLTINADASTITSDLPSFSALYLPVGSIIKLENFDWFGNNVYAEVLSIDSTTQITVNFYEDVFFPVQDETQTFGYLSYENLNYASSFNDEDYIKSFDPLVLELYSKNRRIDGQGPNITTSTWSASFNEDNRYYRKPYASDPYLGIGGYRTNPFYTFECLDAAYEPKARIRMLVRDWDRVFNIEEDDTDENYLSFIENLTDIFDTSTEDFPSYARMDYVSIYNDDLEDIFSDYEYYGTNLGYPKTSEFNDFDDWDDKLPLYKTSDRYSTAYGRFTKYNFPEDYKEE